MLNRSITTTLAALAIAGASVTAAYASEEALLDALVKKGVLKQADAQKIKPNPPTLVPVAIRKSS